MNKINPPKIILFTYIIMILMGTFLLLMPFSTTNGISLIDSLFTATSAFTVTGLIVKSTVNDFTLTGQIILIIMAQIGGLGYMTLMTFFIIILGDKTSLKNQAVLAESFSTGLSGISKFLKQVMIIVFTIEALGVALLYPIFHMRYDLVTSIWFSIFHSISAFNNAGFSLLPDSLMSYRSNFFMNIVITFLIIFGGIGYYVINDIFLFIQGKIKRISTHSKTVLLTTLIITIFGTLTLILTEFKNFKGVGNLNWYDIILVSYFNSISARTAGFNTVDFLTLTDSTLFVLILIMFIGASPGGTGGGIKTITAAVIWCAVIDYIKGKNEISILKKRIDTSLVLKSLMIFTLAFSLNFISTLMISKFENLPFLHILFEVVSASATVSLSVGTPDGLSLSSDFSIISKIIIIICMIIGKLGILSFALAVSVKEDNNRLGHPDARLML